MASTVIGHELLDLDGIQLQMSLVHEENPPKEKVSTKGKRRG
jgi:hypothetical protein